jgi:hypothetical protein
MIEVQMNADFVNSVLNHPSVRPDVADVADGVIDMAPVMARQNVLILGGEHGVFVVFKLFDGSYEVHTAVLPEGRGAWTRAFATAGARFMFTSTDCVEILTRVPEGHVAAAELTRVMGFRRQFTTPPECLFRGERVRCAIYSLTIQDWSVTAPGCAEKGAKFHDWLNSRVTAGSPHEPDPDHNRIVGITLDMMQAGLIAKGVIFYNRYAFTARHPQITLLGMNPPQIRFDAGVLTLEGGQIRLETSH